MLELARYPVCVLPCHTLLEDPTQRIMSDRKYSGSARDVSKTERRGKNPAMREHRHARSSAEDPTISSTRSSKSVSSNARNHPRAELRDSESSHQRQNQGSPVVNHVSSKANGGRKRVCEDDDESNVWVEHTSSSGRVYYYNKKNGVSQWERPTCLAKRSKTEGTPSKHMSHSTSVHSSTSKHSSHPHSSSSHSHSSHSHTTSLYSHSHSSKDSSHRSHSSSHHHTSHSSHHASYSSHHHDRVKEKDRGHSSHRRSNRGSRSSSKSTSVSPTSSRGHGRHEKTTPSRYSRTHGSKKSVSPSGPISKQPHVASSTVAVSPCTPNIPHGISQSLVATQQYINQTSAIIKHQQKLLSGSGDPSTPATQSLSPPTKHTTPHSVSPHARQKLLFTPTTGHTNGPSSQEFAVGAGTGNIPATPVQNSVVSEMSPQLSGMESLHPLQRALLLQQQQQAVPPDIPVGQSTPGTPLPSAGATPLPQSIQAVTPPISALPAHLVAQISHPGSPFSESPAHTPSFGPSTGVQLVNPVHPVLPTPYTPQGPPNSQTPVYTYPVPMMMSAPTPITGIYMTEGGMMATPAGGGGAYITPNTPAMRPPMSKLGQRSSNDEFSIFPDPSQVESIASGANPDLFDRSLAESWWSQSTETLHKQLDSSQREVLSRRTTEALYLKGRLRRAQVSLDSTRVRSTTRRERLLALEHLMSEIDQR